MATSLAHDLALVGAANNAGAAFTTAAIEIAPHLRYVATLNSLAAGNDLRAEESPNGTDNWTTAKSSTASVAGANEQVVLAIRHDELLSTTTHIRFATNEAGSVHVLSDPRYTPPGDYDLDSVTEVIP